MRWNCSHWRSAFGELFIYICVLWYILWATMKMEITVRIWLHKQSIALSQTNRIQKHGINWNLDRHKSLLLHTHSHGKVYVSVWTHHIHYLLMVGHRNKNREENKKYIAPQTQTHSSARYCLIIVDFHNKLRPYFMYLSHVPCKKRPPNNFLFS